MSNDPFFKDEDNEFFKPDEDLDFDENQDFFPRHYDLEEVFDERIHPLLKSIVNICNEYNIPMLTSFQYKNTKDQVMLCTSVVAPPTRTCDKLKSATKVLLD